MRRLALVAAAIAAVLYVPVPIGAHESGGTNALVPVSDIPQQVKVPAGTGVAEAPPAAAPEQAPELVPPQEIDQIDQEAATRAGAVAAPEPEPSTAAPEAVPALQPKAELAQEGTVPEPPPEKTPNQERPPDRQGQDEDDPEEFEEEFDDVPPEEDREGTPRIAPSQGAVPAGDRLPQTGRELLVLGLIGSGLMLIGTGLRGISRPRLQRV